MASSEPRFEVTVDYALTSIQAPYYSQIGFLLHIRYGDGESDNVECMICIEKLVQPETEVVTSMPCSHLFHGECIERWLSTGHLYPLCRFPMPTDAEKH
ncbi:hypothetical protein HRI_000082500 [Hibiscus trionum]|uniref:RING-type E3 ubiquitin transferase n=1 Tax=Hibiscus trionum TaxID=183268 RepID=A0A9W7GR28_HIBTR|nr:hypothetical protein HRI_000082500 [Hibiscus trionum]